jgi:Skp family chaperone for outer membrane proteins
MNCLVKVIFLSGLAVGSSAWAASPAKANDANGASSALDRIKKYQEESDERIKEINRSYDEAEAKLEADARERDEKVAEFQERHEKFQAAVRAAREKLRSADQSSAGNF